MNVRATPRVSRIAIASSALLVLCVLAVTARPDRASASSKTHSAYSPARRSIGRVGQGIAKRRVAAGHRHEPASSSGSASSSASAPTTTPAPAPEPTATPAVTPEPISAPVPSPVPTSTPESTPTPVAVPPTPAPESTPTPTPETPVALGKTLFDSGFASFAGLYVQATTTTGRQQATITPEGAARFEVRPGEYERDTGSQRAEVTLANPKFYEGSEVWVFDKVRWSTADTANPAWEVVDQFHDGSAISGDPSANGSPPIALMRYGQQIRIDNGKGSPVYWTGPTVERGRWYEVVYRIKFSKTAGEVEAFWNGTKVSSFKGSTMNSEYTYFKAGIYRAKETLTGISVVEHDEIGVASTLQALEAGTHMQPVSL